MHANPTQKLCTMLAIVVDCIHAERLGERLDPQWDLTGLAFMVGELGMGDGVLQTLQQ